MADLVLYCFLFLLIFPFLLATFMGIGLMCRIFIELLGFGEQPKRRS